MFTEDPLSNLKDIHLPPSISDWPPAPGWFFLAFLVGLTILLFSVWIWRIYINKKPKIEALKILKYIKNQYYKNNDKLKTLRELSHLIRRISLTYYKKEIIVSIHGDEWLKFLDKTGKTTEFTKGKGSILGLEIYKKNPKVEMEILFAIVKRWINKTPNNY